MSSETSLRVIIIVQARMGSTRLPGKVLKEVLGKPLLTHLIERLKKSKLAKQIVIATTKLPEDDLIEQLANDQQVSIFRGSEDDVLERYLLAAREVQADVIVRITSDCPLMDPEIVDKGIGLFLSHFPQYDYVSNTLYRTYPRGMDVEVFSMKALETAALLARNPAEREHVTLYLVNHPERFSLSNFTCSQNHAFYRWTVDTEEDFRLVSQLFEMSLPAFPTLESLLLLNKEHPELHLINSHIEQKKI
ncbi:hypothetical protein PHSC3_001386 [Chlamydiales bacterium STE3]|nr:hypothetical protein PHSC3_001386 [Chlamydiales bacterium STE3]